MAKDGKKKNKAAKGAGGAKIPKEIAGVKVPKELRKLGQKAVKAARSPVVNEIVAGALLTAAASLRKQPNKPARMPYLADRVGDGSHEMPEGGAAPRRGGRKSAELGDALRAIAFDFARRALDGIEEGKKAKREAAAESGAQPSAAEAPGGPESVGGEEDLATAPGAATALPKGARRR